MVFLTDEMIEENKQKFISLLKCISREGADIDKLIAKLEASDFFTAPASTKYHASYKGGLVDHSLNVYYNLCSLIKNKHLENDITQDSVAIVGLLHDLSKMNYYKLSYKNQKVYSSTGSKKDDGGKFDWVSVQEWAVVPVEERFLYGNHEMTSEFMIRQYIPMTYEEEIAVLHHHGGMGFDSVQDDVSKVFNRYSLPVLLHTADLLACYVDEKF